MVRPLTSADAPDARKLLRDRPLHNIFLDYVVAAGVLGHVPGFFGWLRDGRLEAILMVGPLGGTALEVRDPNAFAPLAAAAAHAPLRPRHIVGSEDVSAPFWREYERFTSGLRWTRREPVFVVGRRDLHASNAAAKPVRIEAAREADVLEVTANSAEQHREDLRDDREASDVVAFRERHARDILESRWWVVRERGRIVFQVHVGAAAAQAVQLGGVFVPQTLRGRGHATRGVHAICQHLLARHELVTLYCDEANAGARRVYERVGFKLAFFNRSYLLDEQRPREDQLEYL